RRLERACGCSFSKRPANSCVRRRGCRSGRRKESEATAESPNEAAGTRGLRLTVKERAMGRARVEAVERGTAVLRGVSRAGRMAVNFRRGFAYGAAALWEPITAAGAVAAVRARLRDRAGVFLDVVERAIFAVPDSPYRPLLAAAGYDLARVRTLVGA